MGNPSPEKIAALAIINGYKKQILPGRHLLMAFPDGFGSLTEGCDGTVHADLPGTKDLKDIKNDLCEEWVTTKYGNIQAGFYRQFEAIYGAFDRFVHSNPQYQNRKIVISGHSEGAAIAFLLAERIIYCDLIAFSCPNFCDGAWAKHFNTLRINVKSIAGKYDLIPDFPKRATKPVEPKLLKLDALALDELGQHSIENIYKALP